MVDKKVQHNDKKEATTETSTLLGRSLLTGFIGGILASLMGLFFYYFNFIQVSPKSYILRSWTTAGWTNTWLGNLVTIIIIGLLSIGVALVYYGLLKRVNSIWMGIVYGIILWAIVYFVLNPIFTNVPGIAELKAVSIVSAICLYILYGTFIGYSISFDYRDSVLSAQSKREEKASN